MWASLDEKAISEAKRQGHAEVGSPHLAYCIAVELERRDFANEMLSSRRIRELMPEATSALSTPTISESLREQLSSVKGQESAGELLSRLLSEEWAQELTSLTSGAEETPEGDAQKAAGSTPDFTAEDNPEEAESLEDILAELDTLVGLEDVKDKIRELIATHRVNEVRIRDGKRAVPISLHLVFTGDPGTGKTTVARLVSRIYRALGLVSRGHLVEVGRPDLVGEYVGHTARRVQQVVKKADGGVLFIDEAYSLAPNHASDFGHEAIATLVKEMEDRRGDMAVIAAGYDEPMDIFIESNPGLRSRFQNFVSFPNYSPDELQLIWMDLAKTHEIEAGQKVLDEVADHLGSIRTDGGTGNARYVRGLFELMFARLAKRANADGVVESAEIAAFIADDVPDPDSDQLSNVKARVGFL